MRFQVENIPESSLPREPQVGDVYSAKGGNGSTALWVNVALSATGQSAHYLGLDTHGQIVSTASYANHAMRSRAIVGRVDIHELVLPIICDSEAP